MSEHRLPLLAPCDDCVHQTVCSIKASLAFERESATLTIPDSPWITPATRFISVECSEFLSDTDVRRRPSRQASTAGTSPRPVRGGHGRLLTPSNEDLAAYLATHTEFEAADHFGIARSTIARRKGEMRAAGVTVPRTTVVRTRQERPALPVADSEGWAPLCMPAEDFAEWTAFNLRAGPRSHRADRPCSDCPAAYAAEMAAKGQCNGTPGMAA